MARAEATLSVSWSRSSWQWAKACSFIRWFSDAERRDAKQLWKLASVYLRYREYPKRHHYAKQLWKLASVYLRYREYPKRHHCKVWREGLEVAIKVKGSQGKCHQC
jgi:hypothetical protein